MTVRPLLALRRLLAPPALTRPAPNRRAAARRAVFAGVGAFVLATVGYAVALDTVLPGIRFPEHGYRLTSLRQLRADQPERPLVVVIGSSRTQMAVDPAAMGFEGEPGAPAVFNYGLVGALPVHHHLAYRRLRAAGVRPAAVVVELFPAALLIDDAALTLYAEYGPGLTGAELWGLRADTHDPVVARNWLKARCLPWVHFRREVQQQELTKWVPPEVVHEYRLTWVPDRFGFKPFLGPLPPEERAARTDRATRAHQELCRVLRVSPLAERAFRGLVADCRADGVPVAFFLSPESPTWATWYPPEARERLAAFLRTLTDELGAPVFDASGGWAEDDFFDGHHMLPVGAAKFSRYFARVHLRPWLATALPAGR